MTAKNFSVFINRLMYILKKKPSKKHLAPVRGRKARAVLVKKILFAVLIIALFGLAAAGFSKLSAVFFAANWRLKEVKISGGDAGARYEVYKYVGFETGDAVTARDAANLQAMLKVNIKQISEVKVRRGFFDKELKITIKKQPPVARIIRESGAFYLAPAGIFFTDAEFKEIRALLPVYLKDKTNSDFLPQELVELIQALAALKDPRITAAAVDMDAKVFFVQADGEAAFADMGGFEAWGRKLKTLARIMQSAREKKLKQPYDINFKYFEDGKIYLKQAE